MNALRVTTFITCLIAALIVTFWPVLLYRGGQAPSHTQVSLLLLGLCIGVVYGSGILAKAPRPWQLACAVAAWAALLGIGWRSLPA
ncbi:cyd operon YbgE family protein [Microbulbifer sp. SA54]|uniref:cyd operon YbgE family protein n=1 Tax=Microbulbifer sp. SA54 TaxID=3401577 RepID=UPI003AAB43B0